MSRATGYTLQVTEDRRYRWLHYGAKPKLAQFETRLFPEAGLYFGPLDSPRFRVPVSLSRYALTTLYLLDGRYAGSVYEYADGSADVSIDAGFTYFSESGESTLSVNINVPVVDYAAIEIKMVAVLAAISAHPDYLPRMNMPKGFSITKKRGERWMEGCLG